MNILCLYYLLWLIFFLFFLNINVDYLYIYVCVTHWTKKEQIWTCRNNINSKNLCMYSLPILELNGKQKRFTWVLSDDHISKTRVGSFTSFFASLYIYIYIQISLNIIDILCIHIFFWIRSNKWVSIISVSC